MLMIYQIDLYTSAASQDLSAQPTIAGYDKDVTPKQMASFHLMLALNSTEAELLTAVLVGRSQKVPQY